MESYVIRDPNTNELLNVNFLINVIPGTETERDLEYSSLNMTHLGPFSDENV